MIDTDKYEGHTKTIDTEEEEYRWRDEQPVPHCTGRSEGYANANEMLHDEIRAAGDEMR